jgi:hypothetical protein
MLLLTLTPDLFDFPMNRKRQCNHRQDFYDQP